MNRKVICGLLPFMFLVACKDEVDDFIPDHHEEEHVVDTLTVEERYVLQTDKGQVLSRFIVYDKQKQEFKLDLSDTDTIGLGFSKQEIDWAKECAQKMNLIYPHKNTK